MLRLSKQLIWVFYRLVQKLINFIARFYYRHRQRNYYRRAWRNLVDHFIPHEGNNHHPRVLKHRILFGYSVVLILLKVAAIVLPIALPSSSLFSSAITPTNIVDLTNQTRINLGLNELKVNKLLASAAAAKAQDILQNQYFAHTSPGGVTPWDWIIKAGYDYLYAGENLAVHYQSAEDVAEGWLASPTHRANIIQPKYTEIGVGIVQGEFEGINSTVVVQMFAAPVAQAKASPISTATSALKPVKTTTPTTVNGNAGKVAAAEVKTAPKPTLPPVESSAPVTASPVPQSQPVVEKSNSAVAANVAILPDDNKSAPVATTTIYPVIYDDPVKVIPQVNSYYIDLVVTGATAVMAQLADRWVPLTRSGASSVWHGVIPFESATFNKSGEQLSVVAWSSSGQVINKALLIVAPSVKTQQFYNFNEGTDKYTQFLGFITIHNLQDKVRQFYFFFIVFLAAALLLNVLIKIRIQHFSVISHTLLVIGLALILLIV